MSDGQVRAAPLAAMGEPRNKEKELAKKKATALGLLVFACASFIVLTAIDPRHHSVTTGLLAAASEAAMVGGLADWFAVVALFRHPLGQRWIPHTAIIPRSKDKIGASLADFICDHFLGKEQVLEKIRAFNPADRLAKSLSSPDSAKKIADFAVKLSPRFVEMLDSEELQDFVRSAAKEKLASVDVSAQLAQLLSALTKDGRHHEVVDSLLTDVAELANDPETRRMLATKIAEELWAIARWVSLDKPIAENIAEKVASSMRKLLNDVANDRQHEVRLRFERQIPDFIDRLRTDEDLRSKIHGFRDRVLANQELSVYIQTIWTGALTWLRDDLASPRSTIHAHVRNAALGLGAKLDTNLELKAWFNEWVMSTMDPLTDEYREKIRGFIVERIEAWSADELTEQLELSMGSDLQYIRYSGTLVGALIGAALYALTQGIRLLAS